MAAWVDIVGWHIHPEAAKCQDCGETAVCLVAFAFTYDGFSLCNKCLENYDVRSDKVGEIFREAGF